jgi:hypothetical protein
MTEIIDICSAMNFEKKKLFLHIKKVINKLSSDQEIYYTYCY